MNFNVISLLPEIFTALNNHGVTGRAFNRNLYQVNFYSPRDYTNDIHRTVDDRPYGGGPGMVMMYQPIKAALNDIGDTGRVIYMSPQGIPLTHNKVIELAKSPKLTILCGRYEGIDQRICDNLVDEQISIGDYVLTGGEIPAMALMDAIIRQLPEVLNDENSANQDSFVQGILDYPHYTRPEIVDGLKVPMVLLRGNHQAIAKWRSEQALNTTHKIRPDLLKS